MTTASQTVTTVALAQEHDVVIARQRARQLAAMLGFDRREQTWIATAVSEIARNALEYGGGGKAAYLVDLDASPPRLSIRVSDDGPGIADLDEVLTGRYTSPTGMGLGIVGARRLMDEFELESEPGRGTVVLFSKHLPHGTRLAQDELAALADELARERVGGPFGELQQQNHELLRALEELHSHQDELSRLNLELEETNRGVMALYSELDERAQELRRASELKSRFLAGVGHELRTPLSSVVALSDLLLERTDGELTAEQERQVQFIRGAAVDQLSLVNDLLDMAQIESGKTTVRVGEFEVGELFGGLRGTLRPLLGDRPVELVFEDTAGSIRLATDEAKLTQVLRNLIANALKFTETGEVRVSAKPSDDGALIVFSVADTGIGIAEEHHETVFEDFTQIESRVQASVRGTGLGLPLARRLTLLLGGRLELHSEPGVGSTFIVTVPTVYGQQEQVAETKPAVVTNDGMQVHVLVVDDEERDRYLARQALAHLGCTVEEAGSAEEALLVLAARKPTAIVLDLVLPGLDGLSLLAELRGDPATEAIPVVIRTGSELGEAALRDLDRQGVPVVRKQSGSAVLASALRTVLGRRAPV